MGGSEVLAGENMRASKSTVVTTTHYEMESVGYKTTGDDGIAASPRLRQMMDDRCALHTAMGGSETIVGEGTGARVSTTQGTYFAQNDQRTGMPNYQLQSMGFHKTTGDDGIAASPRLRQMMNDRLVRGELVEIR
jgi:hypothetical protein